MDQIIFRRLVGKLIYLVVTTHLDIAYAIRRVSQFMVSLTKIHLKVTKKILRYLRRIWNFGLKFHPSNQIKLTGFTYAHWAGDTNDRKSTSRFVFMIDGITIIWSSKKQPTITLSYIEVEY